jgi:hypothetical protein
MKVNKKQQYFTVLVTITFITFLIWMIIFYLNWSILTTAFNVFPYMEGLLWFVIFRTIFAAMFSFYFFYKWFTQEVIYPSDAHFLFGLYFFLMTFGKINDLFIYLGRPSELSSDILFMFFRIRFFLMVVNSFPLLYIGLEALFMILGIYITNFNRNKFNILRISIISSIAIFIFILLIIAPGIDFILNAPILPIIAGLTMLGIVVMFIYMYKKQRLSQVHGLIIGIGFLFFIISSIFVQILNRTENPGYILLAEIVNTIVYSVVLIGFLKKPNFSTEEIK